MTSVLVYTRDFIIEKRETYNKCPLTDEITKILEDIENEANKYKSQKNKKLNEANWRKKKPKILALEYKDDLDKLTKKININLNKLSETNFEKIKENIFELIGNEQDLFDILINSLFDKSIAQHSFCKIYVRFYKIICDSELNIDNYLQKFFNNKYNELQENFNCDTEIADVKDYSDFCDDTKKKNLKIGSMGFFAELYNINLITISKIEFIIQNLLNSLKSSEDQTLSELLCDSIFNIFSIIKDIYKDEKETKINEFLEIIQNISKNKNYTAKIRFKMMDIKDLF